MDDIEIEKNARGPVTLDIKQITKILSEFKIRIESAAARREKRLLIILFAVGFVLCIGFCYIIFRVSFSSYENSFREEIETLEQKVVSLEKSLEKSDSVLKDIHEDVSEMLSEISVNTALASKSAKENETVFLLPQLNTSRVFRRKQICQVL